MSDAFDVVCIGTGITALSYATSVLTTHPGTRILLLEKHRLAGGYATGFVRPKQEAHFDVSLHKLTGMGPAGNLREMFRRLGVLADLQLVYPDTLFSAHTREGQLTLPEDGPGALRILQARFPACASGVQKVFDEIASYGYDAYMQFRTMLGEYDPDIARLRYAHRNLKTLSVHDAIRERVTDPLLREILSLTCIYVGSFPEQTSYLYILHVWYAALIAQSAYLRGGSSALGAAFVRRIRDMGGEVITRAEAQRVLIDRDSMTARGVVTDIGTFIADQVVVNAAPQYALEHLIDCSLPGMAGPAAAISAATPASSTTTLYIVMEGPPAQYGLASAETMLVAADPDTARNARGVARQTPAHATCNELAYWHASSVEVTNYHLLDPGCGYVVVVNALDTIHHWPQRKTDDYRQKKARARDVLLSRLLDAFPAMRGSVRYTELSTPRTYQRYTNNTDGSGYGALVPPATGERVASRRLPVRNLQFVNHWSAGGGYEATIGYGAMLGFQARGEHL